MKRPAGYASVLVSIIGLASAKVADRSRVVAARQASGRSVDYKDRGRPIEGQAYRFDRINENESSTIPPEPQKKERSLSSQLSGCCYDYQSTSANDMCALYGNDCESGETPSHDSGDGDCSQEGLSFIGISFSVNTVNGNPYS